MNREQLSGGIRERLEQLPEPYDNHYGVMPMAPPRSVDGVNRAIALARTPDALSAINRISKLAVATGSPTHLISRALSRQEAVLSSKMEGTNSTLDELLAYEIAPDGEREKRDDDDVRRVRNYTLALDALEPLVRKHGNQCLSIAFIQRAHKILMTDDPRYADVPGDLRQNVVWIGTGDIAYSTYNPPPPARIEEGMNDHTAFLQGEGFTPGQELSLPTRLAFAHAHFEAVHPFRDGNGRVGRLLLPMMMIADGQQPLYLGPYIESNRPQYDAALHDAQQRNQWESMISFMNDAVIQTADSITSTHEALKALPVIWRDSSARKFRRGSGAWRAMERTLLDYPIITTRFLEASLDITYAAANRAIEQLVEADIITERTGYTRNRMFAAEAVLSIINRPFGTNPILPNLPRRQ